MSDGFDVLVIGAGPGGYVAAIRAAQLGLRTAVVEKRATLGGTCLNVGCIPSKALIHSSKKYKDARTSLAAHGVLVENPRLDLGAMMARKQKIVAGLTQGIDYLFKKHEITRLNGLASFAGPGRVQVLDAAGETSVVGAAHIIIATGSAPTPLPGVEVDGERIVFSRQALAFDAVPEHLVVVGAGVIGLELGSMWSRLGSKVTVVEYLDRALPTEDLDVSKQVQRLLKKQKIALRLSTAVVGAQRLEDVRSVRLAVQAAGNAEGRTLGGESPEFLEADRVLVAIGRQPYLDGLGVRSVGVDLDEQGRVKIDAHFRTNVPGIYAIGDVVPGPMLAHKAEEDGIACAERIAGRAGHVNYETVPNIVYTVPEVASVGKTEQALVEAGIVYRKGLFPLMANSRARTLGEADGMVKILADEKTDRLLGCHIVGPEAGTLIHEIVTAMEFGGSAEDIARICHGHPTLNEAIREAALAVENRAIHA